MKKRKLRFVFSRTKTQRPPTACLSRSRARKAAGHQHHARSHSPTRVCCELLLRPTLETAANKTETHVHPHAGLPPPSRARRPRPDAMSKPGKSSKPPAATDDGAALAADVAAFASSLGLAAAAGAAPSDAAFDDFAPERAGRKIGGGKQAQAELTKVKDRAADKAAGPRTPTRDRAAADDPRAQRRPDPRPSRPWNAGAGPAPARVTSLLAKDAAGGALWYEAAAAAAATARVPSAPRPAHAPADGEALASAREEAAALLAAEADAHRASLAGSRDADARWLARSRAAGTAADRVAAAAVAVADAPAASLGALDDLLKTATKRGGGRNSAIAALDALNDLFSGGALLPPTRRLVSLAARPLDALPSLPPTTRSKVLLYWGLEDALCRRAGEHAEALARATRDSVDALKRVGVRGLASRLTAAPEGEADALTALVNKLGDPDRRLAASAARALLSVLDTHPAMAPTLARYVERAAFRPGQAPRARHAAVLFLAGLPLPRGPAAGPLAEQLADCYFGLFRAIVDGTLGAAADARAAAVAGAEAAGAKAAGRAAAKARGKQKKGGRPEAAPAVVQVSLGEREANTHHTHPATSYGAAQLQDYYSHLRSNNLWAGRARTTAVGRAPPTGERPFLFSLTPGPRPCEPTPKKLTSIYDFPSLDALHTG